jgi:hypothetical protein
MNYNDIKDNLSFSIKENYFLLYKFLLYNDIKKYFNDNIDIDDNIKNTIEKYINDDEFVILFVNCFINDIIKKKIKEKNMNFIIDNIIKTINS